MRVRFGLRLETEERSLEIGYQRYGRDPYRRRSTIGRRVLAKMREQPRTPDCNGVSGGA